MFRPAIGQIGMVIGVIPDLVSFIDDAANESGIMFRIYADQKKGRVHVRRFQNIEDLGRPFWIRTVIEGDRDLMLASRALMVERRKFWKLCVFGREKTFSVDGKVPQSIGATFVHRDNFPVAHIRDHASHAAVLGWLLSHVTRALLIVVDDSICAFR